MSQPLLWLSDIFSPKVDFGKVSDPSTYYVPMTGKGGEIFVSMYVLTTLVDWRRWELELE